MTKHEDRRDIRAAAMRSGLLRRFGLTFPDIVEGLPTDLPVLEVRTQWWRSRGHCRRSSGLPRSAH